MRNDSQGKKSEGGEGGMGRGGATESGRDSKRRNSQTQAGATGARGGDTKYISRIRAKMAILMPTNNVNMLVDCSISGWQRDHINGRTILV